MSRSQSSSSELKPAASAITLRVPPMPLAPPALRTPKVLIVDDDGLVRDRARACLESEGYDVTQANDGRAALRLLSAMNELPLVLLDWWMPVMDGERFLKSVAHDSRFAGLDVAIMSTDPDAALRYSRAYIPKPFTTRLLRYVVERMAQRRWPQPCRSPGGCW